jgi:hypothetical protein
MNKLTTAERAKVINCLVEGCSVRATQRMTGFAENTKVAHYHILQNPWQDLQRIR